MPQPTPPLTVLMSVYNGEDTLGEAVDSILAQTFTDFEFLIVNDASTDGTAEILEAYAKRDSRIRIIHNATNLRLAAALNKGLREAKAPLVARMDDDDVSLPERLERQIAFMHGHPEISICGAHMGVYGNGELFVRYPLDDAGIRVQALHFPSVAHASCIYKRQTVLEAGGYPEDRPNAEDYALWAKLIFDKNVRFANLPEILYLYRVTSSAERTDYVDTQTDQTSAIRADTARRLVPDVSDSELACHAMLCADEKIDLPALSRCWAWLERLIAANAKAGIFDHRLFSEFWQQRWLSVCEDSLSPTMAGQAFFGGAGADIAPRRATRAAVFYRLGKKLLPTRLRMTKKALLQKIFNE